MIFDKDNDTVTLDRAEAQAAWSALSHCLELNLYDDPDAIFEMRVAQDMEIAFKENSMPAPTSQRGITTQPTTRVETQQRKVTGSIPGPWNDVPEGNVAAMQFCASTSPEGKVAVYDELYQVILDLVPSEYYALQVLIGKDILDTIQPQEVR